MNTGTNKEFSQGFMHKPYKNLKKEGSHENIWFSQKPYIITSIFVKTLQKHTEKRVFTGI